MLSKSASRAAWSVPPRPSCAAAATTTARCVATRSSTRPPSTHQRRPSSSKASYPPGDPRSSEPATEDPANAAAEEDKRPGNGRLSRRRPRDPSAAEKAATKARDEAFANIPAVPSTNHLQIGDVHTSSFFSLHRPISVTTPIPPVDNPRIISAFNSIFKPQPPPSVHKPSDVIYTLSPNAAGSSGQSKEEKDLRWEILQQSSSNAENASGNRRGQRGSNVANRDGPPPHFSLEDIVKQFRPFHVPPPPVPFDDVSEQETSSQQDDQKQALVDTSEQENARDENDEADATQTARRRPSRKTFTTTLTMTEVTSSSGEKTYTASASPIVERSRSTGTSDQRLQQPRARQPFLAHLYERQNLLENFLEDRSQKEGREMWAISVKRQRKLKMKKHKYKKLMRRTRNLRRREGRN